MHIVESKKWKIKKYSKNAHSAKKNLWLEIGKIDPVNFVVKSVKEKGENLKNYKSSISHVSYVTKNLLNQNIGKVLVNFVLFNVCLKFVEKICKEKNIQIGRVVMLEQDHEQYVKKLKKKLENVKNVFLLKIYIYITKFQLEKDQIYHLIHKTLKLFVSIATLKHIRDYQGCCLKKNLVNYLTVRSVRRNFIGLNVELRNLNIAAENAV